jgi:hypothetical protein
MDSSVICRMWRGLSQKRMEEGDGIGGGGGDAVPERRGDSVYLVCATTTDVSGGSRRFLAVTMQTAWGNA